MLKSVRTLRELSGGPRLSKTGISSRQDAKNAKSGSLISLRTLRLCARYSEFWLRLGRAGFFVVKNPVLLSRSLLPHAYHSKIPLSIFSLSSPVPVL
jgi:hypothetical protein